MRTKEDPAQKAEAVTNTLVLRSLTKSNGKQRMTKKSQ